MEEVEAAMALDDALALGAEPVHGLGGIVKGDDFRGGDHAHSGFGGRV